MKAAVLLACVASLAIGQTKASFAQTVTPAAARNSAPSSVAFADSQPPDNVPDNVLDNALCQIVYRIDDGVPSPRGYRYLFYGNGFFINKEGYIVTAAHVLSQLHGAQPYILLRSADAPARFVQAIVVAVDVDHDVAVLLATPNPFDGNSSLSFLPLAHEAPAPGESVLAAALHPSKPLDAYTLDPIFEDHSPGQVIRFEFSQLEKGAPADTELFLVNHAVHPGQSGSPVISPVSHEVLGFVEGQWLREKASAFLLTEHIKPDDETAPDSINDTPVPGAIIPIHYAIALLQEKGIVWHLASNDAIGNEPLATQDDSTAPPTPLSLVTAPFPSQSFFGGEVLLDALIGRDGTVSDIKVMHGDQPFLEKALNAVRTWTFHPARVDGGPVDARMTIAFEFPQPYVVPRSPTVHHYAANSGSGSPSDPAGDVASDSAAVPTITVEPEYPSVMSRGGNVILEESIDSRGHLGVLRVEQGKDSLDIAAVAAASEWSFAPATHAGAAVDSNAIVVVVFRSPLSTGPVPRHFTTTE
jgi:TonB family protein